MSELYPFQVIGQDFLNRSYGALLADEQGLGKTVEAICAAKKFRGPILVISRSLNKAFWTQQINEWDPNNCGVVVAAQAGRFDIDAVRKWFVGGRKRGYLITHHEGIRMSADMLRAVGIWDVIIADEAHRFKNRKAQQTIALKHIPSFNRWALTGTPIERSPADFWSILHWFDPQKFTSYWRWFDTYVESYDAPFGGRQILGPKNLEQLAQVIAPYYLRRTKMEVAPQLPPKIYSRIPLEMTEKQTRVYDRIDQETFAELEKEDPSKPLFIGNALARMAHLRRLTLAPGLLGTDDLGVKIPWIQQFAEDTDPEDKFVVFTSSKDMAETLPVILDGGAAIMGTVPQKTRLQILDDFWANKLRYVVGTIDTMSESVNLNCASTAIFADPHLSMTAMNQAEDRIHRINNTKPANIIQLCCTNTVDEDIYLRLDKKLSDRELVEYHLRRVHGKDPLRLHAA